MNDRERVDEIVERRRSIDRQLRAGLKNTTADFFPGDRVVYRDHFTQEPQEGTVTSTNELNVFVCYGLPGSTSQATDPQDLEHVTPRPR